MCLLSSKPANVQWNIEHLKESLKTNRDGYGLIGIREGVIQRSYGTTEIELIGHLPKYQDIEAIFHARYATHGTKTKDQLHPYRVVGSIFMAHNGIFNIPTPDATKSDTWHMARRLGSLGHEKLIAGLQNPEWIKAYEEMIGTNKVAFIEPTVGVVIANKQLGHEVDGVWMSNNSYKSYVYDKGGASNYWPPVKKYTPADFDNWTYMHPDDMLDSWMEEEHPWSLVNGDITVEPLVATSAIIALLKKLKAYEKQELLESCEV
jgi:hypothetical protein